MAHPSGPGRYARELARALVRLPDAPELRLYEVGRAPRVIAEQNLGLEGARVRRLASALPRRLHERLPFPGYGPADLALGGVDVFHRILPGTPRIARARTSIAMAELPPADRAAGALLVFCAAYKELAVQRFGFDPDRVHQVAVGCEHWARDLQGPVARAEPPQILVLEAGPQAELRETVARMSTRSRPLELVFARETGAREAELPRLVASASVLVHLVREAGTAVTPLEALALGTPVVLRRLPAFVEALGEQAFWAEPLERALEDALASASDARASRARVGQARPFSWERSAREHLAVWRRLSGA